MNKKIKDIVFMAISLDKFEHCIAFFENSKEGAEYSGKTRSDFLKYVRRGDIDYKNNCRYIRVDLSAKVV